MRILPLLRHDLRLIAIFEHLTPLEPNLLLLFLPMRHAVHTLFCLLHVHLSVILSHLLESLFGFDLCVHFSVVIALLFDFFKPLLVILFLKRFKLLIFLPTSLDRN